MFLRNVGKIFSSDAMSYQTRNNQITVLGTAQFLYHGPTNVAIYTVLLSAYVQRASHAQLFLRALKAFSALLHRKWNRPVKLINRLNNKTGNVRINVTLRRARVTIVVEKK
jgi:hypothetical protein